MLIKIAKYRLGWYIIDENGKYLRNDGTISNRMGYDDDRYGYFNSIRNAIRVAKRVYGKKVKITYD